jgi:hypothetical protein
MRLIKLCECCGEPYEVDDADIDFHVCHECNVFDPDLIGIIDIEDEI